MKTVGFGCEATSQTGLGAASDEQIRIFATELEKRVFGAAGDPFAAPVLVPEDGEEVEFQIILRVFHGFSWLLRAFKGILMV